MRDLRRKLEESLSEGLSEEALKPFRNKLHDLMADAEVALEDHVRSDLSYNLAGFAYRMAEQAIEAILRGNDEAMRRYLRCEEGFHTGRDTNHPVIHGRLFETGAIELRKLIVEAHAELLKSERILDLEDQVRGLVGQVNKLTADIDQTRRELYGARPA